MAAANTAPVYSYVADIQSAAALIRTAASVPQDGSGTIGTDVYKVFQADSTNGGFVQKLRFKYAGTGTTTSNACVLRVYISSATTGAVTDATCWLFAEIQVPATGAISQTSVLPDYELPMGFPIPPSYTILVKVSVTQAANHGFIGTAIGGKY